ncbi:hypothetical protein EJD97_017922, partial [Solanum chilense]
KRSNEMISLDMILIDEKQSPVKITFLRIITIRKLNDNVVNIPANGFQFSNQNIVRSRVNNNTFLSDVVGCICGIGDLESVGSKWKKPKITLWEEFAEGFYPYLFPPESEPYIIVVTTTTTKEFRGEITFTTTSASKTYVNLPTKNITSLIQQFAKKTVQILTIESANGTNIPIDEAMFQNRMTVSELLDSD